MAQDRSSAILALVEELVQEQMDRCTERIKREVSNVFCKVEGSKRQREGKMRESRLPERQFRQRE